MKKKLIAVYGTLRKGGGNHRLIQNAEYLGSFSTEPVYTMKSLGGFPGLKEGGNTSIVMEVYAVNDQEAAAVDRLEGYREGEENWFYDKKPIDTPFGEASFYLYVPERETLENVESGDWMQFIEGRKVSY